MAINRIGDRRYYSELHFHAFKEPGEELLFGECIELGILSCAQNMQELADRLWEAATAIVKDLQKEGKFETFLEENGIPIYLDDPRKAAASREGGYTMPPQLIEVGWCPQTKYVIG